MSDQPTSTPIGREILAGLEEFADLLEAVREVERLRSDLQSARVEISQMSKSNFDQALKSLEGLPQTWYPALLSKLIRESYRHGVWQPNGASQYVAQVEKTIHEIETQPWLCRLQVEEDPKQREST